MILISATLFIQMQPEELIDTQITIPELEAAQQP